MAEINSVQVAVRERPLPPDADEDSIVNGNEANVFTVANRAYAFDHTFGRSCSQEELFNTLIKPLLIKFIEGYSISILAYGQTGTGKSYTMGLNANNLDGDQAGIVPRTLQRIFEIAQNDANYQISASCIEIYNERVYDLLSENPTDLVNSKNYKNITSKPVENEQTCIELLSHSMKNRRVRATKMNSLSSRSHAIFRISAHYMIAEQPVTVFMNFVDLAGTEGVRRTGHYGVALSEGSCINQGLLCLGRVMTAIQGRNKLIPYRDSVLTTLLQDSLNTKAIITLLACISACRLDIQETISTLRFASGAKQIKLSPDIAKEMLKTYMKTPRYDSFRKAASTTFSRRPPGVNTAKKTERKTICLKSKMSPAKSAHRFNQSIIGLTPKETHKTETQRLRKLVQMSNTGELPHKVFNLSDSSTNQNFCEHTGLTPIIQQCLHNMLPSLLDQVMFAPGLATTLQLKTLNTDDSENIELSPIKKSVKQLFVSSSPKPNISANSTHAHIQRRRSMRLQAKNETRNCTSLAILKEEELQMGEEEESGEKKAQKIQSKRRSSISYVLPPMVTNSMRKKRFTNHKLKILHLFNYGTIKQLQLLPLIGIKTATIIVTHRHLNGPFKNWTQVEKAPIWTSISFERFALSNSLK